MEKDKRESELNKYLGNCVRRGETHLGPEKKNTRFPFIIRRKSYTYKYTKFVFYKNNFCPYTDLPEKKPRDSPHVYL